MNKVVQVAREEIVTSHSSLHFASAIILWTHQHCAEKHYFSQKQLVIGILPFSRKRDFDVKLLLSKIQIDDLRIESVRTLVHI